MIVANERASRGFERQAQTYNQKESMLSIPLDTPIMASRASLGKHYLTRDGFLGQVEEYMTPWKPLPVINLATNGDY